MMTHRIKSNIPIGIVSALDQEIQYRTRNAQGIVSEKSQQWALDEIVTEGLHVILKNRLTENPTVIQPAEL